MQYQPKVTHRINEHLIWTDGLYRQQSMSGAYWWSTDGESWFASPQAARQEVRTAR